MEKKLLITGVVTLLLSCLTGCSKERIDIKSFTYVHYSPDQHETYKFDFDNNAYTYIESEYIVTNEEKDLKEELFTGFYNSYFSNEEKEEFCSNFANSNVSKLETTYGDLSSDLCFSLEIEYADGQTFTSKSYFNEIYNLDKKSKKIFDKLGKCFDELVGEQIFYTDVSSVLNDPVYRRACKPCIGDLSGVITFSYFPFEEANYSWNGKTKKDADIYALNLKHTNNNFIDWHSYLIYIDENRENHIDSALNLLKVVITSYDFCKELTNKKIEDEITNSEFENYSLLDWVEPEPNKIYTIDYIYGGGNHYEYTFNTFNNGVKFPCGRYYASPQNPFGYLDINKDMTFNYHFYEGEYDGTVVEQDYEVKGTYEYITFDETDKLVLNMDDGSKIVYELRKDFLYADTDRTTYTNHSSVKANRQIFGFDNGVGVVCFLKTSIL